LIRTMQLCGVRQLKDITPDLLVSQRASR